MSDCISKSLVGNACRCCERRSSLSSCVTQPNERERPQPLLTPDATKASLPSDIWRASEWLRERGDARAEDAFTVGTLACFLDYVRGETIEACAKEAESCCIPGSKTLSAYGLGRKEAADSIRRLAAPSSSKAGGT